MKAATGYTAAAIAILAFVVTAKEATVNNEFGLYNLDDYKEECVREGCSREELDELHESYKEECLNEGCSAHELSELAGGVSYVNDMLDAFKQRGWSVDNDDYVNENSYEYTFCWYKCTSYIFYKRCEACTPSGNKYVWSHGSFSLPGLTTYAGEADNDNVTIVFESGRQPTKSGGCSCGDMEIEVPIDPQRPPSESLTAPRGTTMRCAPRPPWMVAFAG